MYVIVAGCGRVGSRLAGFLSYDGHDVVVIDSDAGSFRRLGGTFNGITLEGVAFDEELLHEAGIEKADAFVAVTNFDNTNLMASELAKNIYDVPNIISRLYYPDKELTFFKMGIDYVCGTTLLANRIREKLFQSEDMIVQQDRLELGIKLVEFAVPETADGKQAGGLNYGVSSRLVALLRENKEMDWNDDTLLRSGDRVIVTLRKEGWKTVTDCIGGEGARGAACPISILPDAGDTLTRVGVEPEQARVVIGGCSLVGSHLAYLMSMEGYRVTVIDEKPELFDRLHESYNGDVLEGVTFEEDVLIRAGIEEADAFTAVTKFDNKNLMAAEVVRHVFGLPHVVARLFNPDKEATYQALGMNYVCGTLLLSQAILERIFKPILRTRTSCFNNIFDIVEFECPATWEGKTVGFAVEKSGIRFAYVVRRNTGYMPDDNFVLCEEDTVTGLAGAKRLQKFGRQLRKMKG